MGLHLTIAILGILNHDVRKLAAHVFTEVGNPNRYLTCNVFIHSANGTVRVCNHRRPARVGLLTNR